ncbi:MAG: hypothetical protein K2O29_03790, partial [Ruminococcus sp.]|nr:hypothetical protein [Ruminococcus sp.]
LMYIQNELNSHKDAIQTLAKAVGGLKPNESEQVSELLKSISLRIASLEQKNNTDASGSDKYFESRLSAVEKQFADLQDTVSKQNRVIAELTRIINDMRQNTTANAVPPAPQKQNVPVSRPATKKVAET